MRVLVNIELLVMNKVLVLELYLRNSRTSKNILVASKYNIIDYSKLQYLKYENIISTRNLFVQLVLFRVLDV